MKFYSFIVFLILSGKYTLVSGVRNPESGSSGHPVGTEQLVREGENLTQEHHQDSRETNLERNGQTGPALKQEKESPGPDVPKDKPDSEVEASAGGGDVVEPQSTATTVQHLGSSGQARSDSLPETGVQLQESQVHKGPGSEQGNPGHVETPAADHTDQTQAEQRMETEHTVTSNDPLQASNVLQPSLPGGQSGPTGGLPEQPGPVVGPDSQAVIGGSNGVTRTDSAAAGQGTVTVGTGVGTSLETKVETEERGGAAGPSASGLKTTETHPPAQTLPSRSSEPTIHPLPGPVTTNSASAPNSGAGGTQSQGVQNHPNQQVTGNTMRSRTVEVPIKPVVTETPPQANPQPAQQQPTGTPQQANPSALSNLPAVATNTVDAGNQAANKEANVKAVLATSLGNLQNQLEFLNRTELTQPAVQPQEQQPGATVKSACETLRANNTNVCDLENGDPLTDQLLVLVNNHYRSTVCTTEHSLNQLYNNGTYSYTLLENYLTQFSKKAPNKTVQDVYDKSVPVVKKLVQLMKDSELALVSDALRKLLDRKNLLVSAALCGVATGNAEVMSSTEHSPDNQQVTLTVNEEDFIEETTNAFMKAYTPMVELLKNFNVLLPQLLDLFEEGFDNKINMLTSLAHVTPPKTVPAAPLPPVTTNPTPAPNLGAGGTQNQGVQNQVQTGTTGTGESQALPETGDIQQAERPGVQGSTGTGVGGTGIGGSNNGDSAPTGLGTKPVGAGAAGQGTETKAEVSTLQTNGHVMNGHGLVTGPGVGGAGLGAVQLLQLLDSSNRQVAAIHGHPSLIQKMKSLLQVGSRLEPVSGQDPVKEQNPVKVSEVPKEVPGRKAVEEPQLIPKVQPLTGVGGTGVGPRTAGTGPTVDVKTLDGMQLLNRTTAGGVNNSDHSQQRTATSGLAASPGPAQLPNGPQQGAESVSPVNTETEETGLGLFNRLKQKLQLLLKGNKEGAAGAAGKADTQKNEELLKKQRNHEQEEKLLREALRHFDALGLFKTNEGRLVAELDEHKVKTLVRTNLLTLNDYDSMYNLVIAPQRSLHSLYSFVEHLLLSPDADERITHLSDTKLFEQIKKMVSPLEDLYEQIKAKAPNLSLKAPDLEDMEDLEGHEVIRSGGVEHHVDSRGNFLLVSNSSGLKLSEKTLLGKQTKKPLQENKAIFSSTCFVIITSVLLIIKFL